MSKRYWYAVGAVVAVMLAAGGVLAVADGYDVELRDVPVHAREFPGTTGAGVDRDGERPGESISSEVVEAELPSVSSELKGFVPPFGMVNFSPGPEYSDEHRKRQGEPTIERAPGGRLWAAWSPSTVHEDRYRYVMAATSGNDGQTWDIAFVIDDVDGLWQITDLCLWLDPDGRLWLFWWQTTNEGPVPPPPATDANGQQQQSEWDVGNGSLAMAMTTENPDCETPAWSEPRVVAQGVPINKPIVTRAGEWILPTATWPSDKSIRINVSKDQGRTWTLRGTANVPRHRRSADEPMIVERNDGSLWMLVRTTYGIGQTVSHDGGRSWPEVEDYLRNNPARFYFRRLSSGNLLLVKYHGVDEGGPRSHLTAYLSEDDGGTWKGGLLLDERSEVSYPDGTQAPDGRIYLIHDRERWDAKEIVMHVFAEEDVLVGRFKSQGSRQKVLVNQARGVNLRHARAYTGFRQRQAAREGRMKEHERTPPRRVDPGAAVFRFGPRAAFKAEEGEIRRLIDAAQLFSNRPWLVQELPRRDVWDPFHPNTWPAQFAGFGGNMDFIFSTYERTVATCIQGGIAYVFTPAADRSENSVERELLAQGFEKTSELEFYLFVPPPVHEPSPAQATSIYQKEVKAGERIEFGEWGLLAF